MNAIRSQGTFVNTEPARKDELTELGFVWEQPSDARRRGRKKKISELDDSLNGILAENDPSFESNLDEDKSASATLSDDDDIFSSLFQTGESPLAPKPKGPSLTDASAVIASQIMRSTNASAKKSKNPATVVNPINSAATDALKADLPAIIDRDLGNLEGIELKDIWHLLT